MAQPIQFIDIPANYKGLPHQMAALQLLQDKTPPDLKQEFETLWRSDPPEKPQASPSPNASGSSGAPLGHWANPLAVPYFSQRDSTVAGQANRMCFSSSCAMLVAYLKPNALPKGNGDDAYLKRVLTYGDTTDASAQIKALRFFGVNAQFVTNADMTTLRALVNTGIPVPCGYLHHGPSSAPRGGGHWLNVIGYTDKSVIVNDPFGEMDVANGGYLNSNGKALHYSFKNWLPRWMVDGPQTGWAIIAQLS